MFLTRRPQLDSGHVERIRNQVRDLLKLEEETPVLVTEWACAEPGCPPVETVIAVLDQPGLQRQFRIHKPLADVSPADVAISLNPERRDCDA